MDNLNVNIQFPDSISQQLFDKLVKVVPSNDDVTMKHLLVDYLSKTN